jgi:hypothetical protein
VECTADRGSEHLCLVAVDAVYIDYLADELYTLLTGVIETTY